MAKDNVLSCNEDNQANSTAHFTSQLHEGHIAPASVQELSKTSLHLSSSQNGCPPMIKPKIRSAIWSFSYVLGQCLLQHVGKTHHRAKRSGLCKGSCIKSKVVSLLMDFARLLQDSDYGGQQGSTASDAGFPIIERRPPINQCFRLVILLPKEMAYNCEPLVFGPAFAIDKMPCSISQNMRQNERAITCW